VACSIARSLSIATRNGYLEALVVHYACGQWRIAHFFQCTAPEFEKRGDRRSSVGGREAGSAVVVELCGENAFFRSVIEDVDVCCEDIMCYKSRDLVFAC